MGYERLEKSLTDTIKEEQAKLGFRKEAIRLYYPLSSLNHFFDVQEREEQMLHRLQHLPETWQEKLGDVGVTAKKERFCFYIPEQGSVYVHEHEKPDEFIRELVELVGRHGCTMQEIRELFCKHSSHVECQKIENGEFDWMLRRMRKIPIIIVLRMRESISFTIVFCRRITGSLESDENRHR